MSNFNREDWSYLSGGRGAKHKSGLVIYAMGSIEEDEYVLKYFNQDEWERQLFSEKKTQEDVDIIKLGLCYQFLEIINEKFKDNAHYIIPDREFLRERIKRFQNKYHKEGR